MEDFDTLAQLAQDPAVTLTVIALLTLTIVLQYLDHRRRMRNLSAALGRRFGLLMARMLDVAERVNQRKIQRAVEIALKLKEQNPDWSLNEVFMGGSPFRARRQPVFDLDELRDAAKGLRPYAKAETEVEGWPRPFGGGTPQTVKGTGGNEDDAMPNRSERFTS